MLNSTGYFVAWCHTVCAVQVYIEQGEDAAREWLRTTGFKNIDDLNKVLKDTATSWKQRK